MKYRRDLAQINHFIDNFDPQEFTTTATHVKRVAAKVLRQNAARFKARIERKRQMEQKFRSLDFSVQYNTNDVMITQEQVDALLNKE